VNIVKSLTSTELTLLRTDSQKSKLYLAKWEFEPVFKALVNGTFSTHDGVVEIPFDNVSLGSYTDILAEHVVWIGTTDGAHDIGKARIRKSASSSVLYIGEESELNLTDNLYLSVGFEPSIWAKHIYISDSEEIFMDYDVEYSNQNETTESLLTVSPILFPLWLESGSVDYQFVVNKSFGSTLSSYAWSVTPSPTASFDSAASQSPTLTITATGQYVVTCTATNTDGVAKTVYRFVKVFDNITPPETEFTLKTCFGAEHNWEFEIEDYGTGVEHQSLIVLFTRDWYGTIETSIGTQIGNEDILAIGWVEGESIEDNKELSKQNFKCYGVNYWLSKLPAFPLGYTNVSKSPSSWVEFQNLTVDKALWSALSWRTNVSTFIDIHLTNSIKVAPTLTTGSSDIYSQLNSISFEAILAIVKSNRYNSIYIQIDTQLLTDTEKSSLPIVFPLTDIDFLNGLQITTKLLPETSRLELSGISFDGDEAEPLFSRANGNIFKRYGSIVVQDRLLLDDQEEANLLAGILINVSNNEYPKLGIQIASNYKNSDIAPQQLCLITYANQVNWNAKLFIPRRIEHNYQDGILLTTIEFEALTYEGLSVTYERPQTPIENLLSIPDIDTIDIPADFDIPDFIPDSPSFDEYCLASAPENGGFDLHIVGEQKSNDSSQKLGIFGCQLRSSSATYKSKVVIRGMWLKWGLNPAGDYEYIEDETDDSWYDVIGIAADGTEYTATKEAITNTLEREFTFNGLASNTKIIGIGIQLVPDGSAAFEPPTVITLTSNVDTGSGVLVDETNVIVNPYNSGLYAYIVTQAPDTVRRAVQTLEIAFPSMASRYFDVWVKSDALSGFASSSKIILYIKANGTWTCNSYSYDDNEFGKTSIERDLSDLPIFCGTTEDSVTVTGFFGNYFGSTAWKMSTQINIRISSTHKIDYTWVKLYNVCDKDAL